MKRMIGVTLLLSCMLSMTGVLQAQNEAPSSPNYPAWAWAIPGPEDIRLRPPRPAEDGTLHTLPDSPYSFTASKIRGRDDNDPDIRIAPADWYPQDHPTMPKIVAEGDSSRGIVACSLCHLPNGKGRPENAPPAGQSREYTLMTLTDMKNGLRKTADPRKGNAFRMNSYAEAMTDEEVALAAEYYAAMKWTPWITVKEVEQIPKMYSANGMWLPREEDAGMEPIGARVIETPEHVERAEKLRGPRTGWIAYVPVGSVEKGKNIVTTGDNGNTMACAMCHGPDLHGMGAIPGIAARSPSYVARQLFSYQAGTRNGTMAAMMKGVVANMTNDDFVNITAYLASLPAQAETPTFNTE